MTKIAIVVAADEQNAIGKKNGLLCYLPNDLKHFKSLTLGCPVIMGRKTYESLPSGALPQRRNIVITHQPDVQFPGCEVCFSVKQAMDLCANEALVFVIGGGTLYNETVDLADEIYLTRIHHCFCDADTFFPELQTGLWHRVSEQRFEPDERHSYGYSFEKFVKNK